MKKFIKNHKIILIICGIILILVIALILFLVFGNSLEKELKKELEVMGREFYEDYYYESLGTNEETRKETLRKYSRIGFKIDLENLARYYSDEDKLEKFINKEKDVTCDKENTMIIIYPKGNFEITDYDIEVILECSFDN